MRKCFAMDDARLKELGCGGYFKELLARIRAIRASEKVFYRQVLEIYATSIDYDPRSVISCFTDSSRIGRATVMWGLDDIRVFVFFLPVIRIF